VGGRELLPYKAGGKLRLASFGAVGKSSSWMESIILPYIGMQQALQALLKRSKSSASTLKALSKRPESILKAISKRPESAPKAL
jgi:hypothetical protein